MPNRRTKAHHIHWSKELLEREIHELEQALAHQGPKGSPGKRWKWTLIVKSLEDRRRMLAALRHTGL